MGQVLYLIDMTQFPPNLLDIVAYYFPMSDISVALLFKPSTEGLVMGKILS